ncbi:hypothetical protein BDU57DRAFT_512427 [Ampelomyces quisqualis]|uniref:AAA+ ATPase domain-containing protein n=1 Tax=Ampelomyces quisqualis TaxID=50730 RepID=A0A6A5QWQ6_AMPQU|nr:hypothetical protein BDU57DRAFT_512427 [Ampelomyces quisqualis]
MFPTKATVQTQLLKPSKTPNTFSSSQAWAHLGRKTRMMPSDRRVRRPQGHSADIPQAGHKSASSAVEALQAMNSDFFNQLCENIKRRTGGRFDVHLFIAACVGVNAARATIPAILTMIFDQIKTKVSSSIAVSPNDYHLNSGLLRLASGEATASGKAWYNFSGEHELASTDGNFGPLPGKIQKFFRHDGTLFILEKPEENQPAVDDLIGLAPAQASMTVRCFGHSNAAIRELFDYVRQQQFSSKELAVVKIVPGSKDAHTSCNKRHLSTVDLDPQLKERLITDAQTFFADDSGDFYLNTGMPFRRGWLLHGPAGTGKTSVSKAIASHFDVPLILITLKGMSDKDLIDAFNRVPYRSVILLEDIDCAGAEVEDRDAKVDRRADKEAASSTSSSSAAQTSEYAAMQSLFSQQAFSQQRLLNEMATLKHTVNQELGLDIHDSQPPVSSNNGTVSLSNLLNVIDGADAAEGRLLIMTTNCPEKLDPALLRAGRCDEKFKIDFATKVTAPLTFKRIFGLDKKTVYKPATIDRFAAAFAAQFPSRSRVSTAELSKYLGHYRGRPEQAIEEFADWLNRGDDKFSYRLSDQDLDNAKSGFNVPEEFDRTLLRVGPGDLVDDDTKAPRATIIPPVGNTQSAWNLLWWGRKSASMPSEALDLEGESSNQSSWLDGYPELGTLEQQFADGFPLPQPDAPAHFSSKVGLDRQNQVVEFFHSLGLGLHKTTSPHTDDTDIDLVFDDMDFEDFQDFQEPDLRCVSPRHIKENEESIINVAQTSDPFEELHAFYDTAGCR